LLPRFAAAPAAAGPGRALTNPRIGVNWEKKVGFELCRFPPPRHSQRERGHDAMVKVVLENKEALSAIEDRIQKAVDYVLESNPKLRSGERKLMRNKLTQLTSCLTLKVPLARAGAARPARTAHACCAALPPLRLSPALARSHPPGRPAFCCCPRLPSRPCGHAGRAGVAADAGGSHLWADQAEYAPAG